MHLGIALPFGDIGGDGPIGANSPSSPRRRLRRPDAGGPRPRRLPGEPRQRPCGRARPVPRPLRGVRLHRCLHEKVELSTQVLILAQRQTVLVAKQAASLDVLSGGRFRFGIGVGWNEMEFVGLNENFHNRGKRSEEQVQVMKALWADPYVTFEGKWHRLRTPASIPGHLAAKFRCGSRSHGRDAAADRKMGRRLDDAV